MPRVSRRSSDVRITLRLPPALCARVDKLAEQNGGSRSGIIRAAIEQYCGHGEPELTCYDLAMRLGVIGVGSDKLPPDLSSNPKYMEGFGRE